MKHFIFCFLIVIEFIGLSSGQKINEENSAAINKVKHSSSARFLHKLSPIDYTVENYHPSLYGSIYTIGKTFFILDFLNLLRFNNSSNDNISTKKDVGIFSTKKNPNTLYTPSTPGIIENPSNIVNEENAGFLFLFSEQGKVLAEVIKKLNKDYEEACHILESKFEVLATPPGIIISDSTEHPGYYMMLVILYKVVGKYDRALQLCEQGFTALENESPARYMDNRTTTMNHVSQNDLRARFYNLSGETYHLNGDYFEAIKLYNKALNHLKQVSTAPPNVLRKYYYEEEGVDFDPLINDVNDAIAKTYGNLGSTYYALGNYEKSIEFYNKAHKVQKEPKNKFLLAEIYNKQGNLYNALGNHKKALEFYNDIQKISKKHIRKKNHPFKVPGLAGISNTYYMLGDYKQALIFQQKAVQILEKKFDKGHPYTGQSYSKLGSIYYTMKDYKKAMHYQKEAVRILSKTLENNHPRKAFAFNNLAITTFTLKEHEAAISLQKEAIKIIEQRLGHDHPETVSYRFNLAEMYRAIGDYQSADALWRIIIPQAIGYQNNSYLFLPDEQRLEYLNIVQSIYAGFYAFALENNSEATTKLATDLLLNTKSLALDYGISFRELIALNQMNDNELTKLAQVLNAANRQLIRKEMDTSDNPKNQEQMALLRQQRDNLVAKMLQDKDLKVRLNTQTTSWQTLQNRLNNDEAIIDFLLIDEEPKKSYCAIVIHKTDTPQLLPLADESAVNTIIDGDNYVNNLRMRKQLYKEIWQPLEVHLKGIKTIYLSPSGGLHKIAFEALQNDKRQYLGEHLHIRYYPAMRDFAKVKSQHKQHKNAVLLGHILYDLKDSLKYEKEAIAMRNLRDKITPLKATLAEVNEISDICKKSNLETTLLTIDAATEEAVKSFTGFKSPNIYHFATHGIFLDSEDVLDSESGIRKHLSTSSDPLKRSALMLYGVNHTWTKGEKILGSKEDGILTALEVTALDLQNTDLVVLSACSTGLGNVHNTEGVFGLQRAFKLAGVNHVVASLWNVDDDATKDLMVKFYENLLKEKQDPATALRNAKNYFRNKGYEPTDWAGFILIE